MYKKIATSAYLTSGAGTKNPRNRHYPLRGRVSDEKKLLYPNAYTLESDSHTYAVARHAERQFNVLLGALLVVCFDAPVVHPNIPEG